MPEDHPNSSEVNQIKMDFEKEFCQNANPNQRH